MSRALWWRLPTVVALALVTACSPNSEAPQARPSAPAAVGALQPSEPFAVTSATLRSPDGAVAVAVPVYDAYTPKARSLGLMHRKRLPKRAGMVFRFPQRHRGGFYMKNTLIPLSIAFIDGSGTVVDVLDMPPCKADPCPIYTPGADYVSALEVNRGFFDQVRLERGWRVQLPPGLPAPK